MVSDPTRDKIAWAVALLNDIEGVHAPRATIASESEEARDIVAEDERHEVPTIDETCGLENILVLPFAFVGAERVRVPPLLLLVDAQKHIGDILSERSAERTEGRKRTTDVMITREDDEKSARGRREELETVLSEGVWIEETAALGRVADRELFV